MSNQYKNEKTIKVGEVEILLRPNFENLAAFETNVITLDQFAYHLVKGKMPSLTQLIQALFYFQAEKKFTLEEMSMLVQNDVGIQINNQVLPFLSGCIAGYKNQDDATASVKKILSDSKKKS